jgi:uncharacterized protein YabE (DUF348 family)
MRREFGRKKKKNKFWRIIFWVTCFFVVKNIFFGDDRELDLSFQKAVVFDDGGVESRVVSSAGSVEEFLEEQRVSLAEADIIYPIADSKIFSGSKIIIQRAKKIKILVDGGEVEDYTFESTVESAVLGASVELDEFDILSEPRESFAYDNLEVKVTRVQKAEEIVKKKIAFEKVAKTDDEMSWRKEVVKQKGEKGVKEMKYVVVYHDGEEISRKLLSTEITKEPVDEVVVKGTYVKTGKRHTGLASWYAQPQHLKNQYPSITGYYAANPWLPKGSYVKVTNKGNGKSIVAVINDRGPFVPDRIIDLDKKAFAAIASIGAGVANIRMEEVKN